MLATQPKLIDNEKKINGDLVLHIMEIKCEDWTAAKNYTLSSNKLFLEFSRGKTQTPRMNHAKQSIKHILKTWKGKKCAKSLTQIQIQAQN